MLLLSLHQVDDDNRCPDSDGSNNDLPGELFPKQHHPKYDSDDRFHVEIHRYTHELRNEM